MTRTQENARLQFQGSRKIEVKDFIDTIKFFDKHLIVGAELERVVPKSSSSLARSFNCNSIGYQSSHEISNTARFYKSARSCNEYNVAFVTNDISFEYGNEIIFGGNNEGFQWNYKKLKLIEDKLNWMGAIPFSPKTSTHITVLTSYNRKMNGVIIKNIFNIVRAFSGALYWMGSGDKRTILRSGAKHYAKHSLAFSPYLRVAKALSTLISKNHQVNLSKQDFVNGSDNELDGLLVEFRCTDGIRSPATISALMQLYKAIVYKSVELSIDGTVMVESMSSDWRQNKIVTNKLLECESLTDEDKNFLITESKNLINLCMNYLKRDDKSCVSVLDKIAEMPVSIRLQSDKHIETIDKELYEKEKTLNNKEKCLLNIIIKNDITASSVVDWKKKTAEKMECSVRYVEKMLINIMDSTKLSIVFDCEQETMRID